MPDSFEALEGTIKATYERLVKEGALVPQPDTPAPSVPLDLEAAKKAGKVRRAGSALLLETAGSAVLPPQATCVHCMRIMAAECLWRRCGCPPISCHPYATTAARSRPTTAWT